MCARVCCIRTRALFCGLARGWVCSRKGASYRSTKMPSVIPPTALCTHCLWVCSPEWTWLWWSPHCKLPQQGSAPGCSKSGCGTRTSALAGHQSPAPCAHLGVGSEGVWMRRLRQCAAWWSARALSGHSVRLQATSSSPDQASRRAGQGAPTALKRAAMCHLPLGSSSGRHTGTQSGSPAPDGAEDFCSACACSARMTTAYKESTSNCHTGSGCAKDTQGERQGERERSYHCGQGWPSSACRATARDRHTAAYDEPVGEHSCGAMWGRRRGQPACYWSCSLGRLGGFVRGPASCLFLSLL